MLGKMPGSLASDRPDWSGPTAAATVNNNNSGGISPSTTTPDPSTNVEATQPSEL